MPVSIIGTKGAGKSTFLNLLYQTMRFYTNDPKTRESLKYYWPPENGQKIENEKNTMQTTGDYPDITKRRRLFVLTYLLGFKPRRFEQLLDKTRELIIQKGAFKNYLCMILRLYDISGEDISRYNRNPEDNKDVQRVFDSNIMVLVLDTSKFTNEIHTERTEDLLNYDSHLANIMSAYIKYKVKKRQQDEESDALIHPIIVLAQADALDKDIIDTFKLEKLLALDPKKMSKEKTEKVLKTANKIGNELMKSYLPSTNAILHGSDLADVNLGSDYTQYFLSWTDNERRGEDYVIKTDEMYYSDGKRYISNLYSRHMYQAFLEYLRDLAEKSFDREDLINEVFGDDWKEKSNII